MNEAPFLFIAGLWRDGDGEPDAFTTLTTDKGEDIAPYHDRQIVVFAPAVLPHWLFLTRPQNDILRLLPPGSLSVETVRPAND